MHRRAHFTWVRLGFAYYQADVSAALGKRWQQHVIYAGLLWVEDEPWQAVGGIGRSAVGRSWNPLRRQGKERGTKSDACRGLPLPALANHRGDGDAFGCGFEPGP